MKSLSEHVPRISFRTIWNIALGADGREFASLGRDRGVSRALDNGVAIAMPLAGADGDDVRLL